MNSINTLKTALDNVYGKNSYSLETSYGHLVGKSKAQPRNAPKVYRVTHKGQTGEWLTNKELMNILTRWIESQK